MFDPERMVRSVMPASFDQRMREALRSRGKALARRTLGSRETRRYVWATWALTRLRALHGFRPIYRFEQVEWDSPGHARAIISELVGPSANQVLIRSIVSAVSLGAERAHLTARSNTDTSFPSFPGRSLAGEVVRVGRSVRNVRVGQLVAAPGAHASLVTADEREVFPLPAGVSPEEGSFIYPGILCLHGMGRGELRQGERVAVIGRGPVGQICLQLAHALGAGALISVGLSRPREAWAVDRFANRILAILEEGEGVLDTIQADVTFEVSGSPAGIRHAKAATRNGGRIVLIDGPRPVPQNFGVDDLAERSITLVEAPPQAGGFWGYEPYGESGERFLELMAGGALDLRSLIDSEIDPGEVGLFYRRLALGRHDGAGALVRWDALPDRTRSRRVTYLVPPRAHGWPIRRERQRRATRGVAVPLRGKVRRLRRSTTLQRRSSRVLRIAVIGCGVRGIHQAMACQEAERTDLSMVMDVSEPAARSAGDRLGVPWTTDYERVLNADDVDAVLICSPHHLHEPQAVGAARAGKRIILEKPLAPTLDGATRILRAARESGVELSVWLGFRYEPEVVRGKEFVDSGGLGPLLGAHLGVYRQKGARHHGDPEPDGRPGWKGRWETAGGGVLIMSAIHYLDWLLYLTGLNVTEVSARYDTLESGDDVEDSIAMWLRFENGALATVHGSYCVPGRYRYDSAGVDCRLWGSEGHLSLTPPFQFFSCHSFAGRRPERWHSLGPFPALRSPSVEYLDRFARSVLEGRAPEITGMDGLRLQAVVEAAYVSGRQGRPVQVRYPDLGG
jgi:predicted dehydrogenase/NADPH:quinone reductase-like Zn-dependent oxidoreductase